MMIVVDELVLYLSWKELVLYDLPFECVLCWLVTFEQRDSFFEYRMNIQLTLSPVCTRNLLTQLLYKIGPRPKAKIDYLSDLKIFNFFYLLYSIGTILNNLKSEITF